MLLLTDILVPPSKVKTEERYVSLSSYLPDQCHQPSQGAKEGGELTTTTSTTQLNITIVGESCVGKTSLVQRMTSGSFSFSYVPTFGVNRSAMWRQDDRRKGQSYCLRFLDTNDVILDSDLAVNLQDRLDSTHARLSDVLVIVYDITDHTSFQDVKDWLRLSKQFLHTPARFVLVGNKADRTMRREVHRTAGEVLAKLNQMDFLETSCLDGFNVQNLLTLLCRRGGS